VDPAAARRVEKRAVQYITNVGNTAKKMQMLIQDSVDSGTLAATVRNPR
jgi:hypothetical protein